METMPKTPTGLLARRASAAAKAANNSPSAVPSPDDLARFYKALTTSFDKIQSKDQKSQLVNAAKKSILSDCFREHEDVLNSYLGYLQVFAHISGDTFEDVTKNVLVPTFRMDVLMDDVQTKLYRQVHGALASIFKENSELGHVYVNCLGRNFPASEKTSENSYLNYVYNVIRSLDYLTPALSRSCLIVLIDKIILLDIVTGDSFDENDTSQMTSSTQQTDKQLITLTDKTIDLLYDYIDEIRQREDESLDRFFFSFVVAFQRVVVGNKVRHLHYLAFYLCSLKENYAEEMVSALWNSVAENECTIDERRASLAYISSLLSRAEYIDFGRVITFLETAIMWCHSFLDIHAASSSCASTSIGSLVITNSLVVYYLVCQAVFYIIAQRHRDLFEPEMVDRIESFNLNRIVNSHLQPLHFCQTIIAKRFESVCDMYEIVYCSNGITKGDSRSKFSKSSCVRAELNWHLPIGESDHDLPARIEPLYRGYFDCSNFTVHREV